ncbi:MAG: acyl-CoA dehydrogenase family protein [Pseudomonadales bacterium]|nr:acyl-CoA dehydrogenase family protein [Pseudomonadales bacterium]
MSQLEHFRAETRAWLEENCPASMRTPMPEEETVWGGRNATYVNPDSKVWLDRMAAKGWTCPTWPAEYGGGGLSKEENLILQQELGRIRARPALTSFGISMLGPVLLEFATEEQKKQHIPGIIKGEIRWCQGYSEPGSGSDLASLQTKAVLDGDTYVINGQKIWTSYADKADWIFCLVRTDPDAPKHSGISFILFDMTSPGVTTKPIKLISGSSPFCETFFDDVRVPKANLIPPLNEGWTIAKRLLQHERTMISNMGMGGRSKNDVNSLEAVAKRNFGEAGGKIADSAIRDRITQHKMNGQVFALTMRRSAEEAKLSTGPSATSSMFKYYGTEHNKDRYEVTLETMGTNSLGWEGDGFEPRELNVTREWLRSKANSIEGGTSEVQLNVIAKRVLGLPD